jgi:hypothetical protein
MRGVVGEAGSAIVGSMFGKEPRPKNTCRASRRATGKRKTRTRLPLKSVARQRNYSTHPQPRGEARAKQFSRIRRERACIS